MLINPNFISLSLSLIAYGSLSLHRKYNNDAQIEFAEIGKLIFAILPFCLIYLMYLNIEKIFNYKWYFCIIIAMLFIAFFSYHFALLYSKFFGFKSKPFFSLEAGGEVRLNLYYKNFFLTGFLAIITYLLN